jgi:hypothetical protein
MREDKVMVKPETFSIHQNCPFWTYIKNKTNTFNFGAQSFLFLVHIHSTPNESPKNTVNQGFSRHRTMKVRPWKKTILLQGAN